MKRIIAVTISALLTASILNSCSNQSPLSDFNSINNQVTASGVTNEPLDPNLEAECLKVLASIQGEEDQAQDNLSFLKSIYQPEMIKINFYQLTKSFANNYLRLKNYSANSTEAKNHFKFVYSTVRPTTIDFNFDNVVDSFNDLISFKNLEKKDAYSFYRIISQFDQDGTSRNNFIDHLSLNIRMSKNEATPEIVVNAYEIIDKTLRTEEKNIGSLSDAFYAFNNFLKINFGNLNETILTYKLIDSMLKPGESRLNEAGKIMELGYRKNINGAKARDIYKEQKPTLNVFNPNY
jgi:hypothetical protein